MNRVLSLFFWHFIKDPVNEEYEAFPNKRLPNNVIKTVMTSSRFKCTTLCSRTNGCLAVNVIGNRNITCELTTGLNNENQMEDDSSSELYVLGKSICFYWSKM